MKVFKQFLTLAIISGIILVFLFFSFNNKSNSKNTSRQSSKNIASEKNSFVKNIFQTENLAQVSEITQTIDSESSKIIDESAVNFDKIIKEIDLAMMSEINPLLNKIKVDKNKPDKEYAREMKNIIEQVGNFIPNLSDPKNLLEAENLYRQKAVLLSSIKPSVNFRDFHAFWTLTFASKAYLFRELSREVNPDRKYALLNVLDSVVDSESQLINNFAQSK